MKRLQKNWKTVLIRVILALSTLITVGIHIYLNNIIGEIDLLFTGNAFGYIGLGLIYLIPIRPMQPYRKIIWWLYLGYTLLTLSLWLFIGVRAPLAYWAKSAEGVIIISLILDRIQTKWS